MGVQKPKQFYTQIQALIPACTLLAIFLPFVVGTPSLILSPGSCGQVSMLTCTSVNIVEGDFYSWFKYRASKVQIFSNANEGTLIDGKYNGTSINGSLVLHIIDTSESDIGQYTCDHGHLESNAVELSLTCPQSDPASIQTMTSRSVVEGNTTTLTALVNSHGSPRESYIWYHETDAVHYGPNYTMANISRTHTGTYTLEAVDNIRPTGMDAYNSSIRQSFYLDVFYTTTISSFTLNNQQNNITVNENDTVTLRCTVDSNPVSDVLVQSATHTGDAELTRQALNDITHTIQTTCYDAGTYRCYGQNNYTASPSSSRTIQLFVFCSPRPRFPVEQNITYNKALNTSVELNLTWFAYPEPPSDSLQWMRLIGTNWVNVTNDGNTNITTTGLESHLYIHSLQQSDFGKYRLSVWYNGRSYYQLFFVGPQGTPYLSLSNIICIAEIRATLACSSPQISQSTPYKWCKENGGHQVAIYDQAHTGNTIKYGTSSYNGYILSNRLVLNIKNPELEAEYSCEYGYARSNGTNLKHLCNLTITHVGVCGGETTITCLKPDNRASDKYCLRKDGHDVHCRTNENKDKYESLERKDKIVFNILHTSVTDSGKYSCDYGYILTNTETLNVCSNSGRDMISVVSKGPGYVIHNPSRSSSNTAQAITHVPVILLIFVLFLYTATGRPVCGI